MFNRRIFQMLRICGSMINIKNIWHVSPADYDSFLLEGEEKYSL